MKVLVENYAVHEWCVPFRSEAEPFGPAVQVSLWHLHNVRFDVDPAGRIPRLRRSHLLSIHALVDPDDVVLEEQIIPSQSL